MSTCTSTLLWLILTRQKLHVAVYEIQLILVYAEVSYRSEGSGHGTLPRIC